VIVKGRIKTKPGLQWKVGREFLRRIKKEFDARDIEIPFPHQTLYFGDASRAIEVSVQDKKTQA
jgi:small conductance mechanosensitive channel